MVLRKVRDTLRASRHLSVAAAVAQVNPILRGWVNYFKVGNSSQAFNEHPGCCLHQPAKRDGRNDSKRPAIPHAYSSSRNEWAVRRLLVSVRHSFPSGLVAAANFDGVGVLRIPRVDPSGTLTFETTVSVMTSGLAESQVTVTITFADDGGRSGDVTATSAITTKS
jgi:hypothetical protein